MDRSITSIGAFHRASPVDLRKPLAFSHYGRALARQRLGQADAARLDLAAARKLDAAIDERVRAEGFPVAEEPK